MKPLSDEIAHISYHEAGHVIANYYLGWRVGEIYIKKMNGGYGGVTAPIIDHDKRSNLLGIEPQEYAFLIGSTKKDLISILIDKAFVLIAGQSAENIYTNKPLISLKDFPNYGLQIYETDVYKLQVIEGQLKSYLNYEFDIQALIIKCNRLIRANWRVVQMLAETLLASDGLGMDQPQIELLVSDLKRPMKYQMAKRMESIRQVILNLFGLQDKYLR